MRQDCIDEKIRDLLAKKINRRWFRGRKCCRYAFMPRSPSLGELINKIDPKEIIKKSEKANSTIRVAYLD